MIVVGIDVGVGGAIAFMLRDSMEIIDIVDMPVDAVTVSGKTRHRVSDSELLTLLGQARGANAFIERPEGRPLRGRDKSTGQTVLRQPGAAGMLSLGESFGIVRCACTATGMRVTEMRPGEWKRDMGVKAAKDESLRRARELFPEAAKFLTLKSHDGRAESALIARWGASKL